MPARAADIFLGRQPIFDRRQRTIAYELLFRSDREAEAGVTDDALATASLISQAFGHLGVPTVLGACHGFVNVDAEMLMSRRIESLPKSQVVIELLETVAIDDQIVNRCQDLRHRGYRLALDDICALTEAHQPLLQIVDIVKIDILQLDDQSLAELVQRLRLFPARLLAEKVDTLERARRCMKLGFELFQGFFFGRPAIIAT